MTKSDEELIRGVYEAFEIDATDEILRQYVHPEVEWRPPPNAPEPGPFLGIEGVRKAADYYAESFEFFSPRLERILPGSKPGQYLTFVATHVRGKGSGAEVTIDVAHLLDIRDGKVIRFEVFIDRDEGLRAAGLDAGAT